MEFSDVLQLVACILMPVGICLVLMAIGGLLVGLGSGAMVAAGELWFVGRELDLKGGEKT